MHFDWVVLSKAHKDLDKNKCRRAMFHDTEEWFKVWKKTYSVFQKWHEKFAEFSTNHSKVPQFHFDELFLSKIYGSRANKKYRRVIFHDTEQWFKIWINSDLAVSKMAWRSGWTFIRAIKSLKTCALMGSFCPKHIMFQSEYFRGIMCHDPERWCKI